MGEQTSRAQRGLAIAGAALAAAAAALAPPATIIYRDAFPADADRRAALAECAQEQGGFNRWFAAERAACYARMLQRPPLPPPVPRRVQIASRER